MRDRFDYLSLDNLDDRPEPSFIDEMLRENRLTRQPRRTKIISDDETER